MNFRQRQKWGTRSQVGAFLKWCVWRNTGEPGRAEPGMRAHTVPAHWHWDNLAPPTLFQPAQHFGSPTGQRRHIYTRGIGNTESERFLQLTPSPIPAAALKHLLLHTSQHITGWIGGSWNGNQRLSLKALKAREKSSDLSCIRKSLACLA